MNYQDIQPILHKIEPDRQGARRHYGVHPYFTRRPYNVVRDYICNYSEPGDKILDPFGGSGVTAIEAFLLSRTGIQNDINPLANFIADGLHCLSLITHNQLHTAFTKVINAITPVVRSINAQSSIQIIENWESFKKTLSLPPNVLLPQNSDVLSYYDLFSPKQLLSLAAIKDVIEKLPDAKIKHAVLLAWSATLSKINKTFLSADGRKESRGGSSIFSIYRYKVAEKIIELDPLEIFNNRAKNIIRAQKEILFETEVNTGRYGLRGKYVSTALNATELDKKYADDIDYIFTDPPYGAHIAYLDLSTLWNAWLGKLPENETYENELIVGGDRKHTEDFYINNLFKSVNTMSACLKDNRYFSVVFQHRNAKYFEAILEAAFESGCHLVASVPQGTGTVWSMHKKKGKHSVLAGELILTFHKINKKSIIKSPSGKSLDLVFEEYIANRTEEETITEEEIFNDLIVICWKENRINELDYLSLDIPQKLSNLGFFYDTRTHTWKKKSISFQAEMF